ncbi:MAG: endonuclease/exonuclease/phosphatase family protein [Actinomycetes bacterium]
MVVLPAQKLRILSWNILHGEQIPPTKKLTAEQWKNNLITAATEVSQNLKPDFIGLQEVDLNQNRSGNLNQTKVIAESLELKHWAYIPTLIGTPGEKWKKVEVKQTPIITNDSPNQIVNSMPPSYGIGFATNQPIKKLHFNYLGRSIVGMPLLIPSEGKAGARFIYVQDEPRVALIAELENGLTITTTHLSFAPGVNIYQLGKLSKFLDSIPGKHLLSGDFNLPADLPTKLSSVTGGWSSLIKQNTYPSWAPKIQFDYLLAKRDSEFTAKHLPQLRPIISDHIPIGAEVTFN